MSMGTERRGDLPKVTQCGEAGQGGLSPDYPLQGERKQMLEKGRLDGGETGVGRRNRFIWELHFALMVSSSVCVCVCSSL